MQKSSFFDEWFSNIRGDILAGVIVALALIPEALAFSFIAGVDPKVGLYAAFSIAVVSSITGGRPAMISAATGSVALIIVSLAKSHGVEYVLAAGILAGALQFCAGTIGLGSLMSFVSRSVITGFVNSLAILIFLAQLPQLRHVSLYVYAMVLGGLSIIYILPRFTKSLPAPLVCIIVLTAISLIFHLKVRTVGDMGSFPDKLPVPMFPSVPISFRTLEIILPYSIAVAVVGLLESLMTASIVDDFTHIESDRNRECRGQGIANIVAGVLGGMPGCAMIGQTVVNLQSGGRGRLSTFVAGASLLMLVLFAGQWVRQIPMAALVAVMIMVSISTFSWRSILNVRTHPKSASIVMVTTVVVVVATGNLAIGVLVGVVLSSLFFASETRQMLFIRSSLDEQKRERSYFVQGQVFFASSEDFVANFDFTEALQCARLDLSDVRFWDITAVEALDKVVEKFRQSGISVQVTGLTDENSTMIKKYSMYEDLPSAKVSPR
ncbi:SulP family inorganic anion transporter [Paraburkholderia sp. BCC1884]|uniref:SulP family inorganic anion transporter n=1 Tax=Paraburkholderia sp. BCC1884 TaxID=2562668 RepID=UPI0011830B58|nr:SulP family inorganic anion transporter [Paraburkholderia sp. BCC1884]